jgi:CheY-like chemotaxis protein
MSNLAVASVLTVEDDPITRAHLRLVLEDAGFEVCPDARDGVEAVELAREHRPDLILLDLGLPRLDGVSAARRILSERDVPIVALTGRSLDDAGEALAAGAMSYVLKPVAGPEIVEAVQEALRTAGAASLAAARAESRAALAHLLELLGYSEDWADELEASSFRRGKLWRISG